MDDAHKSQGIEQDKTVKISKTKKQRSHAEIVKLVQANHLRTVKSVRNRQDSVLYKDSGC